MSYEIVLQSEAIWDLQEAFDWYEIERKDQGMILLKKLKVVI